MEKVIRKNDLTDIQKKLFLMLKWFHSFCRENDLRYFVLGGTMLGAVRHEGFIPWDDDVDVGMPRKDYEIFLELCKGKFFGNYVVETIDTDQSDFFYGYSKIYDISTTLVESARHNVKRGIYMDLFPLDGVCDSKNDIPKMFRPIYWRYNLLMARNCAYSKKRKWYKNLSIFLGRLIPNLLVNNKKLMTSIDKLCRKNDYDDCKYIANYLGNWGINEIVPKKVMGKPELYHFEDTMVYGAENYDAYLTSLYGNWRQLPPKEKRITHHEYVYIALDKSFFEE